MALMGLGDCNVTVIDVVVMVLIRTVVTVFLVVDEVGEQF